MIHSIKYHTIRKPSKVTFGSRHEKSKKPEKHKRANHNVQLHEHGKSTLNSSVISCVCRKSVKKRFISDISEDVDYVALEENNLDFVFPKHQCRDSKKFVVKKYTLNFVL